MSILLFFDNGYLRDNLSSLNQNSVASKTYYFIIVDHLNNGKHDIVLSISKIIFVILQAHTVDKSVLEVVRVKV